MSRSLRRFLQSEQLESRRPLAADLATLDVNDDMSVTVLDALIIINEINRSPNGASSAAEAEGKSECDTNDDGVVSAIDVRIVVNQINTGLIAVPTDSTDTTITEDVVPLATDSDDNSTSLEAQVNETDVSSPSVSDTDDSDGADSIDDTSNDSPGPSDQLDETDGDDENEVVSEPNDDGDASDDTTDDETSDDDSSTVTDTDCDQEQTAGERLHRGMLTIRGHPFANLDANGDGALSSDEVPEGLWDQLLEANTDASDTVTKEELKAYREAQRVVAVEAFFEQLDNDDAVTIAELLAVPLPSRWRGH